MRNARGFTIVELLIVIVVIGILAAITIVAFNGIQQRAANTKTTSAAAAWIKGVQLYYHDKNGEYPLVTRACLGTGYPMGFSGTGTTQCRTSASDVENTSLNAALSEYMGNKLPSPDMTAIGTSSDWFRGILYYSDGTGQLLAVTLRGISTCPQISGGTYINATTHDGGLSCRYKIQV